jgi:8-oxo-dGTP diphosphatase
VGKADQGIKASAGRYMAIPRVLAFLFNAGDVLLLKGALTKRIWANHYNGVGGHVEASEDVYTAARREIGEETGLEVKGLRLRGVVNIDVGAAKDGTYTGIMMFVFSAQSGGRETRPSEEGALEWVPLARLAEYDLVQDLSVLLERIGGMGDGDAPFFARYAYDEADRLCISFADQE